MASRIETGGHNEHRSAAPDVLPPTHFTMDILVVNQTEVEALLPMAKDLRLIRD